MTSFPNPHKEIILTGIRMQISDDYERTKRAFSKYSADAMKKQYAFSGQSRQEILDNYRNRDIAIRSALEWAEANL